MDNLNEEIDLVLAGSLYEILSEQDPQDGAFVWMDRSRSKKEPETPDEDEEEREEPERDGNKAQKRAAALKKMKKGRRLAKRRASLRRIPPAPDPRGAPRPTPAPSPEPEEPETATSDEKKIIIPNIAPGGGARFVGGLRYVGTPFDTNMRKFVDKTPIGKYSTQIVALMRTFATLAITSRILNSFESERLAGVMRQRIAQNSQALAEELSQDQQNFIKDSAKEFEKVLDEMDKLFDNKPPDVAEFGMVNIISNNNVRLRKEKKQIEADKEAKDAYFKNNYLLEPLMKAYAKVLANYQWSEEAEEAGESEPETVTEGKLTTIKVDFNELRTQSLNEGFLETFGGIIELVLGAMFGNKKLPMAFTGSEGDIHAFADTIGREKRYMDAVRRYGLDHPTTYKNKARLGNSIKSFERETGIKWPFK